MAILPGSRYQVNPVDLITDDDGDVNLTIEHVFPVDQVVYFSNYTWLEDDRIDLISYNNYGDPTMWWQIANVNPEILDWSAVNVGTTIRIPDVY